MSSKKIFGVIGAMDSEVKYLTSLLTPAEVSYEAGLTFHSGDIGGHRLIVVKSGIGKVNAARCTQLLIDRFSPDYIINSGVAGGISDTLAIGDIVIGQELVQYDFDVSAFGHAKGYLCTGGDDTRPTAFRSDETLVSLAMAAAHKAGGGQRTGRIATGDAFLSDTADKRKIAEEFRADAAEMEGAAIAQTAAANGVPFMVIRAISDLADGTSAEDFVVSEQQTADAAAKLVETLIRSFDG